MSLELVHSYVLLLPYCMFYLILWLPIKCRLLTIVAGEGGGLTVLLVGGGGGLSAIDSRVTTGTYKSCLSHETPTVRLITLTVSIQSSLHFKTTP